MGAVRSFGLFFTTGLLIIFFQNCGGEFRSGMEKVNPSNLDSIPDFADDNSALDPDAISKSYIFMGSQNSIVRGYMDHQDDTFHRLPDITMPTQGSVNWMEFDQQNRKIFAVSDSSPNSFINVFDLMTDGGFSLNQSIDIAPGAVHLNIDSLGNDSYFASTASYNQNIFAAYRLNLTNATADDLAEVDFTPRNATAYRTHSTTRDPVNNLIYVANSDIGQINIFRWDGVDTITELGEIGSLVNPRIVYYSERFQLLYLVTENRTGPSMVYVFRTTLNAAGALDTVEVVSSYQLNGDNGADLKIDYSNGYILATVRQVGASGVHFIPLDNQGMINLVGARQPVFVPSLEHPRSVSLSMDGKFVFLTYNIDNQMDLTILKVIYGQNGEILRTEKIGDYEMGGINGYPSNMVIDELNDSTFH